MFDMDKLYRIMDSGWNVYIECKGKGRSFEMSFEATANRVVTSDMTGEEKTHCLITQIHAVGDDMEEIVRNLESKIYNFE